MTTPSAPSVGCAVGDTVTWSTAAGGKATGKVLQIVTTGTLRPPVGPAIPAPAVMVQVGQAKIALPASKVTKVTAAAAAVADPAADSPFGGLAPTITLHDIELCRTGTWQASTGTAGITDEDLQSILNAAKDPEVDRAPVHPGHFDARFSIATDGEPALGWVVPTAVRDGRLIGDLVDVPAKMAAIIPKAYPRRSVELAYGIKTPAGKEYGTVCTGLGLLGVQAPAVQGLADVVARYSLGSADYEVVEFAVGEQLSPDTPTESGTSTTTPSPSVHDQSVSVDGTGPGGTVSTPITDDELRTKLGLPADYDVTAIRAGLPKDDTKTPEAPAGTPPAAPAAAPAAPAAPAAVPAQAAAPAAPAVAASAAAPGTATLSQGVLDQLVADAAAGRQANEALAVTRRDGIIAAALSGGKLAVAEREAWRKALDEDEPRTVTLLSALQAGRVPVTPQGHASNGGDAATAADAEEDKAFAAFSAQIGVPQRAAQAS